MRIALAVLSACSAIMIFIVAITWLGYRADPAVVAAQIRSAVLDRSVVIPTQPMPLDTSIGLGNFTDCQAMQIATHIPREFSRALASALYGLDENPCQSGPGASPSDNSCVNFREEHPCVGILDRLGPLPADMPVRDYWRYWWAGASTLAVVLDSKVLSLAGYRSFLKFGTYVTIALLFGIALLRYGLVGLAYLPLAIGLAFGFEIPLFGGSISYQPGLLIGLLLVALYVIVRFDRLSLAWNAAYAAVVGAIVFCFDVFGGNVPAVMIVLILMYLCGKVQSGPVRLEWRPQWSMTASAIVLILAFTLGAVYAVLLRCIFRAAALGQSLAETVVEWLHALSTRVENSVVEYDAIHFGPVYLLKRIYYKIDYATFPYLTHTETLVIYGLCMTIYIACAVWAAFVIRHWTDRRIDLFAAVLVIAAVVPAWFMVFANHTAIHSWMTGRLASLFCALPFSLALLMAWFGKPVIARRSVA